MYIVYILYSSSIGKYYVGFTNDLERRLLEHNRKKGKYADDNNINNFDGDKWWQPDFSLNLIRAIIKYRCKACKRKQPDDKL